MKTFKPIKARHGYSMVWNPKHINASKNGYVLVHRMVMADYLGRKLKRYEIVHHKNHIKTDNRICNLVVMKISEHLKEHNYSGLREAWKTLHSGKCSIHGCKSLGGRKTKICRRHYQRNWWRKNHGK